MKEQLISFETAKLAKEKGVKLDINGLYWEDGSYDSGENALVYEEFQDVMSAPTQSLLQKWLREVHNCFIDILPHRDGDSKNKQWKNKEDVFWTVEVDYYGKNFEIKLTNNADFTQHFNKSYEEALEIGLYQALKLIK